MQLSNNDGSSIPPRIPGVARNIAKARVDCLPERFQFVIFEDLGFLFRKNA
jgi:hypothetical protein